MAAWSGFYDWKNHEAQFKEMRKKKFQTIFYASFLLAIEFELFIVNTTMKILNKSSMNLVQNIYAIHLKVHQWRPYRSIIYNEKWKAYMLLFPTKGNELGNLYHTKNKI